MRILALKIFTVVLCSWQVFGEGGRCLKSTQEKVFSFGFIEHRNCQKTPLDLVHNVGHHCEIMLSAIHISNYLFYSGNGKKQ